MGATEGASTLPVAGGWSRRTKVLFGGLILVAVAVWYAMNLSPKTRIKWGRDLTAAMALASERDVPVVVHFTGPGCMYCWAMERNVLPVDRVEKALDGFVAVRIDVAEQPGVASQFSIEAVPTFVVIDEGGRVLGRTMGYQSVEAFTAFLSRSRDAWSSRLSSSSRVRPTRVSSRRVSWYRTWFPWSWSRV